MEITRRGWLGLATTAGAAALAEPLLAQAKSGGTFTPGANDRNYAPVVERLKAFAAQELADKSFPGMSVALVAPDGFSAAFASGFADLDRRIPATRDQLFQIGSITKSLTALTLFVLADRGKLDLDARVQDLLPEHPLPPEPITLTHLLEHSSGLPNSLGDSLFPDVPGERLWSGFTPGSRYSYCNLGYAYLGAVAEKASGLSFAQALQTLVLRPLGMSSAVPVMRTRDRAAFASGHARFRDDVPWLPGARLTPARWSEFYNPAGSVAASAGDMIHYLRFVGSLVKGGGAPLFSRAMAERFGTPTIASSHGPGARYGNGLATLDVEGRSCLRHTGGMPGFSSSFTVDRQSGVGCYASVNVGSASGYRPTEITEVAMGLLNAAAEGRALPAAVKPKPAPPVKDAERIVGRWLDTSGPELSITERGGALFVTNGEREHRLRQASGTVFITDHPALYPYALVYTESEAPTLRLGNRLLARDRPPTVATSPRLAALAGAYQTGSIWTSRRTVFAAGDRLFVGTDEVFEAPDGSWRFKNPDLLGERVWFQHMVGGRPQTLNFSGTAYSRLSAPV
jgi:CubicO group peptidase (beta-lactamase class C family)